ncbi:hypothetical protein [Nitrospira sp. KM1]|uniref:hypothetical protein n=1 Tax=Nitrospira sp. KM1 TaxID=1936990 RepID=UPI001564E49A|nr:hypothetical protein [Nitrospira sp. KM1]
MSPTKTPRYIECFSATVFFVIYATISMGCSPRQFTTLTVYDTPHAFVRLEADRTITKGSGHDHPATMATDQMAAVLRGVILEEPMTRFPLYDDVSQPRRHHVFDDGKVDFLAPLLTLSLGKAMPEEVVTFYLSKDEPGGSREVTSGGVYVQDDLLHLILGNYRSSTHYIADIGVADTADDRLSPMLPIAPQQGRLDFEPRAALQSSSSASWSRLWERDPREIVVRYQQLPGGSARSGAAAVP